MSCILRPYQTECLEKIKQSFEHHQSCLAVLATGLGKTVIFSQLAADNYGGKTLVLAHREELILQAADKIRQANLDAGHLLFNIQIEKGLMAGSIEADVVAASVQSLCQPKRLRRYDPSTFDLIIVDEAHHSPSKTYRRIIDYFTANGETRLLGVTATPKRKDQMAMGEVYDHVAYEYSIEDAVDDGWLVDIRQRAVHVEDLDFSSVRSYRGDLSESDLEKILKEENILHRMAKPTVDLAGDQPTLVFCVTVAHAQAMAQVISRYKSGSAKVLTGKDDAVTRGRVISQFRNGGLQFLVNVGLFLEGFDAPETAFISMCRPTQSLSLYTQVIGRGTRPHPSIVDALGQCITSEERCRLIEASSKPHVTVLDFVGNSSNLNLIKSTDLLGGRYGESVRRYAANTIEKEGEEVSARESLDRASAERDLEDEEADRLARIAREESRRRNIRADRARYTARDVDVFGGPSSQSREEKVNTPKEKPTKKQINFLVHLGVERSTAEQYSKSQAGAVINRMVKRKEETG